MKQLQTPGKYLVIVKIVILITISLAACTQLGTNTVSHGGLAKDHVTFVDALRAKGLTVEIVDQVQQPFLQAKGTRLRISGGVIKTPVELQSYNYNDTDLGASGIQAAEADIAQIKTGNLNISWNGQPHWFHSEKVIVLYVGSDPNIVNILTNILGPQIP